MKETDNSYKQIVKSTGIYGTSQLINIVLGVVRSKLTAIFLGPVGIGIIGLLQSVIDLSRATTGLGLETGATKNIATTNSENKQEVEKTLYSVNIWFLATGLLGAIFCILFAYPLSIWAFESDAYTLHIVGLSLAVFLITLTAGIISSLQGLRRIPYMALSSSIGSFLSLLAMIPIYYYWGVDGIVPTYIVTNLVLFLVALFFYKKLSFKPIKISIDEVLKRGKNMFKLGIYLVLAAIMSSGSLFLVRAYINREDSIETVGYFQTAWIITALMWGIVLRSTNSEFFPKLCAIIEDKKAAKKFVNEQTYIVLLIVSPLIIGLVTFAHYIIQILYTSDFIVATSTLRWHLVAAFFKIISTPMATIMLAKNRGGVHLICESIFWGAYLLAFYLLYPFLQLEATGVAYLIAYLIYMPTILVASYKLTGITWHYSIILMIIINMIFIGVLYIVVHYYYINVYILGSVLVMVTLAYSIWKLKEVINFREVIGWVKKRK